MDVLFSVGLQNAVFATLLAVVACCVTRIWKNPPAAHWLWLLVLVKLITPPIISLEIPRWPGELVPSSDRPAAPLLASEPRPYAEAVAAPVVDTREQIPDSVQPTSTSHVAPFPIFAADLTPDSEPRQVSLSAWSKIWLGLRWMWAIGAAVIACVAAIRIVRFQRMLAGLLPAGEPLQTTANELADRLGLQRRVDLRLVDSATSPLVWCFGRRATIILPRQLLSLLDDEQLAMVLVHELAHLRRRDHLVRIVELVVATLYWWNPVVWWVRRRLHVAEEQCCDAWVSWVFPEQQREYADSLFKAAESVACRSSRLVLGSSFLHRYSLKTRIEAVLRGRSPRILNRWAAVCVAISAIATIPVGVSRLRAEGTAQVAQSDRQRSTNAAPVSDSAAERPEAAQTPAPDAQPAEETNAVPAATAAPAIPKAMEPFQGTWDVTFYGSLKWPAEADEARTWQWTIRGQEITWTRPGRETIRMSFEVEPDDTANSRKRHEIINFTILNGPQQGMKCPGIFVWWLYAHDTIWIAFQDPGAATGRPTTIGFNGYDRDTVLALHRAQPRAEQPPASAKTNPAADHPAKPDGLQVFQGMWSFDACESVLWDTPLEEIRKSWKWAIQGHEMTWTRGGTEPVRMSLVIDPTREPKQIDFHYLDGPDKGKTSRGIYEFERNVLWICMTEPGAEVSRPEKMAMSGTSKTALIILQNVPKAHIEFKNGAQQEKPDDADSASMLEGDFRVKWWTSEWSPAKPDEFRHIAWKVRGRQIELSRPGQETVTLSFTVDASRPLPEIDLTFLSGPDKGKTCRGVYLASRDKVVLCFQDPGADVARPTFLDAKPGSHTTSVTLFPTRKPAVADELQALGGEWKFEIYYSDWWPARISNPPFNKDSWRWTVRGNEVVWTGLKIDDVRLSFVLDPSKSPKQIDLTILDGPFQGKVLRGMYELGLGDTVDICVADPDGKTDRPTEVGYSTNSGKTWISLRRVRRE